MSRVLSLWGPCAAYMLLIFALSHMSRPPGTGYFPAAHAIEYAVLGALATRAVAGGLRRVRGDAAGWAWLGSSLYGVTDEWHQSFVPGRVPSLEDITMDSVGAALGATLVWAGAAQYRRRANR